ncbi:MAG: ribbon-helix-helix domain-containing protein [Kiritimatiellae bacterium]|nr:ribbon-helix-helix domain-containing protein [Kiritimatiellia bacterium]
MSNVTVNISFQDSLLREIDRVAHGEARSRSEFLREAARLYIQRKERWAGIFVLGRKIARGKKLKQQDVSAEIAAYRKNRVAG